MVGPAGIETCCSNGSSALRQRAARPGRDDVGVCETVVRTYKPWKEETVAPEAYRASWQERTARIGSSRSRSLDQRNSWSVAQGVVLATNSIQGAPSERG